VVAVVGVTGADRIRPLRLSARWALPLDADPLQDAALLVDATGRIAAIGPSGSVPNPPDARTIDLGDVVLLPGLVNTHTHLELGGFAPSASDRDFRNWILSIRRLKQARTPPEYLAAARRGVLECWAGGVTTLADTGDSGAVIEVLRELGGSGVAYHEVFGPHPDDCEEVFRGFTTRFAELTRFQGPRVRLGASPHAPYTVSGPLYARVATWAAERQLPLAVHLAESPAEHEFVSRNTGPFAEAWQARGIPLLHDPRHRPSAPLPHRRTATPVTWLDQFGVLSPRTLGIHMVHVDQADISLLAERGVAIAHCPVSNAAHGHGPAPLAGFRRAGLRVGVGTDSTASVGALDLVREMRAARSLGGLSDTDAVTLGTLGGARALGLDREIGSLTVGKWGDVIAVRPASPSREFDPRQVALAGSPETVMLTVLGGRIVHQRPGLMPPGGGR
jgi:cytosine/adenosine deaminase-related metal-dependent hydrolase